MVCMTTKSTVQIIIEENIWTEDKDKYIHKVKGAITSMIIKQDMNRKTPNTTI